MKKECEMKRSQILAAFNSYGQWRELEEHLGVPKSTPYGWTLEGEKLDRRGGGQYKNF